VNVGFRTILRHIRAKKVEHTKPVKVEFSLVLQFNGEQLVVGSDEVSPLVLLRLVIYQLAAIDERLSGIKIAMENNAAFVPNYIARVFGSDVYIKYVGENNG